MNKKNNFAIIGTAGFVAPKHLQAIKETNSNLVAALDTDDSVGVLDRFFFNVSFFTEFERFDRYLEKLKRDGKDKQVDYVSICTPNYLHDAHAFFALRLGAHAICEKPLTCNPWNLDALEQLEKETGKRVYNVLQLRVHPSIVALKEEVQRNFNGEKYEIDLTYITPRGKWYFTSWKGDVKKSGGIATNIGVHLFDMLLWIFGDVVKSDVHLSQPDKNSGYLELEKARVKWYLSVDKKDISRVNQSQEDYEKNMAYRSITVNGNEIEFSTGFKDLHTKVYEDIMNGKGFGISDARPAVELVADIRNAKVKEDKTNAHRFIEQ